MSDKEGGDFPCIVESSLPSPNDDLLCIYTTTSSRCPQQRVEGKRHCDKHLKFESSSRGRICNVSRGKNRGRGRPRKASTRVCRNLSQEAEEDEANGKKHCDKHLKFERRRRGRPPKASTRLSGKLSLEAEEDEVQKSNELEVVKNQVVETRSSVKAEEEEHEETGGTKEVKPYEIRCTLTDGRGRCRKPKLGQQIFCEEHFHSDRLTRGEESRTKDVNEEKLEVSLYVTPPDELRCNRNDGKDWRCKNWKIHGKSLCQEHYVQSLQKSRVRASKAPEKKWKGKKGRGKKRKGIRKESEPKTGASSMKKSKDENFTDDEDEEETQTQKKRKRMKKNKDSDKTFIGVKVETESDKNNGGGNQMESEKKGRGKKRKGTQKESKPKTGASSMKRSKEESFTDDEDDEDEEETQTQKKRKRMKKNKDSDKTFIGVKGKTRWSRRET
ncbi:glutamic acid-rich protein-like [Telopea speciosissima]|uniref:glutamic acid-rich protein-like n=1 Tax=Telopea speciosissima TaxID=54955 RepID=UPI001CC72E45|nr:glutamic acid-rich protein-like [Telopea speciosissima]